MVRRAVAGLVQGESLAEAAAEEVMAAVMAGEATPAQIAALAVALRMKGETAPEVAGFARAMRRHAVPIRADGLGRLVDTCGTGGDGMHTINVSTGAAFVVAGAGIPVAKHGNRSVSSKTGSADVLEALGVAVDLGPEQVRRCLERTGIAFLFAPVFHPAMRHAAAPRRELEIRTVFNILGPLTNPAGARLQLVGVYEPRLVDLVANALIRLGVERALVVHGMDGLDELTVSGPSLAAAVEQDRVERLVIEPAELGLPLSPIDAIRGDGPAANAEILREVLSGERHGPARDVVLLNAAAALWVAGAASSMRDAVRLAADVVDSGRARERLDALVAFSCSAREVA